MSTQGVKLSTKLSSVWVWSNDFHGQLGLWIQVLCKLYVLVFIVWSVYIKWLMIKSKRKLYNPYFYDFFKKQPEYRPSKFYWMWNVGGNTSPVLPCINNQCWVRLIQAFKVIQNLPFRRGLGKVSFPRSLHGLTAELEIWPFLCGLIPPTLSSVRGANGHRRHLLPIF